MIQHFIARGFKIAIFFVVFAFAAGFAVMALWNWLMPDLFGLGHITWVQALGLLALTRILFGHWGGGKGRGRGRKGGMGHGKWKQRWKERYERMSEEEKEAFKQRFKGSCTPGGDWPWKETIQEEKFQPKGDPFQPEEPAENGNESSQAS